MTQDEIRKLLGGYATNALSADERRILFQAALEDQELFNALQDEDNLRELLADPVTREQVRQVLEAPDRHMRRPSFWSRRWMFGVAIPAVAAVILIVVMNRANAPRLIAPVSEVASVPPAPSAQSREIAPPPPVAPAPKLEARQRLQRRAGRSRRQRQSRRKRRHASWKLVRRRPRSNRLSAQCYLR